MNDAVKKSRFPDDAKATLSGAWRFAVVSVLAYGIWAFGGRMSTVVLYSSIALAFVVLSGLLMYPLVRGPHPIRRFYAIFVPGFLLYAVLWCAGWFGLGGEIGENWGSGAGLAAFAFVIARAFKAKGLVVFICFIVLFLFHTVGYQLGSDCYYGARGKGVFAPILEGHVALGKLLWGLFYGLGFGAGIGYAFHRCQESGAES